MKVIVSDNHAHRVRCGSILDDAMSDLFSDGRRAKVLYCDPPWGDGHMKFFATMASKDTGRKVEPASYEALEARLFDLIARYVTDHVFIETGYRWKAGMLARMEAAGLKSIAAVDVRYGSDGKNVLLYGSKLGWSGFQPHVVANMKGPRVPYEAVRMVAEPGKIVFDPCCGLGLSAQAAIRNGMEFRGNELNPKRLDRTIARLSL